MVGKKTKGFWGSAVDLLRGELRSGFTPLNGVSQTDSIGLQKLFGGANDIGGKVKVTSDTALAFAAYLNCAIILSEDISSLPTSVYMNTNNGTVVAKNHPVHYLLHNRPNRLMSASVWHKLQVWKTYKYGNAYNIIERDNMNRPVNLWPLPDFEVIKIDYNQSGRLVYTTNTFGDVDEDDILHYKRLSDNGIWGKNLVNYSSSLLGMALSGQKYGKDFFENGAQYDVLVKHPQTLSNTAKETIKKDVENSRNAPNGVSKELQRTMVLEEGMTIEKISFSPAESTFIESQKWNSQNICGLNRIPLEMVGMTENSNNSISEQSILNYVKFGLTPWLIMMEEENNYKLFRKSEYGTYFTKNNMNAILRGDLTARTEAYAKLFDRGIYNGNEIRDLEDMPHYEGGDIRLVPVNNLMPLTMVTEYGQALIDKQKISGKQGIKNTKG